jgi:hypothetical protein
MFNNQVIQELVKAGVQIKFGLAKDVSFTGAKDALLEAKIETVGIIEGFYKSNEVFLFEKDGEICCMSRYGTDEGIINNIDSLAGINYCWWRSSRDRFEDWQEPESFWLPHLIRMGLVKAETKTIYLDTNRWGK